MPTNVVLAVYDPPASGLPYLAAVIINNTFIGALAAATAAEALGVVELIGDELSRINPTH
ncbi:MAG TPA: hypothetical protein VM620_16025 [Hyphomicrobium sp.]|jgi:hypothetical protein|nr:hypothetical protein [Hyphomicrobium sp.]